MRHPELAILSHHTTIFTTDARFAVHLFPRSGVVELRIHKVVSFFISFRSLLLIFSALSDDVALSLPYFLSLFFPFLSLSTLTLSFFPLLLSLPCFFPPCNFFPFLLDFFSLLIFYIFSCCFSLFFISSLFLSPFPFIFP